MKGLKLIGIKKTFERGTPNEKVALDGVDLEVAGGDFITVLGSNGAGKSTLFNAILGKFRLDRGQIILDGEDITRQKDYQRALNIGCLYQNPLRGTAPNMTIEENLALAYTRKASPSFFAVNRRDSAYFQELLKELNLGLEESGPGGPPEDPNGAALRRPATGGFAADGHHRRTKASAAG